MTTDHDPSVVRRLMGDEPTGDRVEAARKALAVATGKWRAALTIYRIDKEIDAETEPYEGWVPRTRRSGPIMSKAYDALREAQLAARRVGIETDVLP